jgi:hypothetical protein
MSENQHSDQCLMLNPRTEGDRREGRHAKACRTYHCEWCCRCWCHGMVKHPNGALRADAESAEGRAECDE